MMSNLTVRPNTAHTGKNEKVDSLHVPAIKFTG